MQALQILQPAGDRPGTYVTLTGRPDEPIVAERFDRSGLRLIRYSEPDETPGSTGELVFYASRRGLEKLQEKAEQFRDDDTPKGAPRHGDLIQSIGALQEARLRALWRGPAAHFPQNSDAVVSWEVWLLSEAAEYFAATATENGLNVSDDRLYFPEETVIRLSASRRSLIRLIRNSEAVTALAKPATTAEFFDEMDVGEQPEWSRELLSRTKFTSTQNAQSWVTILDTGITLSHPLLQGVLDPTDRHASNPAWGLEDVGGHGTSMAGLAVYGDLTSALQSTGPLHIRHRLESVKVIPDVGVNPHHLLGAVTRNGINVAESHAERQRIFALASSTYDDYPHDGAPTSWSTEMDQLAAGTSGGESRRRLIVISAGNVRSEHHQTADYHSVCDAPKQEIEAPGQAWNPITVGAYTSKTTLSRGIAGTPLAAAGDLSPFSKTASWGSVWPLKPEIVLEGGNLVLDRLPPAVACQDLSLLTTYHRTADRHFTTFEATSAATALAARMASKIWCRYPERWPETIRALLVASARWTPAMLAYLPRRPKKGDYERLFRRYGYGVPDVRRAMRSAADAVTLIVEDTIVPYTHSTSPSAPAVHNQIKFHELPWPVERLRELGPRLVTLRVALSTFIEPNPAEEARGKKLQYGSHGLRFKLIRVDEDMVTFERRINAAAVSNVGGAPVVDADETHGWTFGPQRRDVGSLHIDELSCPASDLALRRVLAIHPVAGWWKSKLRRDQNPKTARYSLIIEIDAGGTEVNLFAEVEAAIAAQIKAAAAATV